MSSAQLQLNYDSRDAEWTRLFADVSPKLRDSFKEFHQANPHVYEAFKALAYEGRQAGQARMSHWLLLNIVRWSGIRTTGKPYKINNDYFALYVRLLIWHDGEFEGVFSLKGCKRDRKI